MVRPLPASIPRKRSSKTSAQPSDTQISQYERQISALEAQRNDLKRALQLAQASAADQLRQVTSQKSAAVALWQTKLEVLQTQHDANAHKLAMLTTQRAGLAGVHDENQILAHEVRRLRQRLADVIRSAGESEKSDAAELHRLRSTLASLQPKAEAALRAAARSVVEDARAAERSKMDHDAKTLAKDYRQLQATMKQLQQAGVPVLVELKFLEQAVHQARAQRDNAQRELQLALFSSARWKHAYLAAAQLLSEAERARLQRAHDIQGGTLKIRPVPHSLARPDTDPGPPPAAQTWRLDGDMPLDQARSVLERAAGMTPRRYADFIQERGGQDKKDRAASAAIAAADAVERQVMSASAEMTAHSLLVDMDLSIDRQVPGSHAATIPSNDVLGMLDTGMCAEQASAHVWRGSEPPAVHHDLSIPGRTAVSTARGGRAVCPTVMRGHAAVPSTSSASTPASAGPATYPSSDGLRIATLANPGTTPSSNDPEASQPAAANRPPKLRAQPAPAQPPIAAARQSMPTLPTHASPPGRPHSASAAHPPKPAMRKQHAARPQTGAAAWAGGLNTSTPAHKLAIHTTPRSSAKPRREHRQEHAPARAPDESAPADEAFAGATTAALLGNARETRSPTLPGPSAPPPPPAQRHVQAQRPGSAKVRATTPLCASDSEGSLQSGKLPTLQAHAMTITGHADARAQAWGVQPAMSSASQRVLARQRIAAAQRAQHVTLEQGSSLKLTGTHCPSI